MQRNTRLNNDFRGWSDLHTMMLLPPHMMVNLDNYYHFYCFTPPWA